jgi:hypothetical protein
MPTLLRNSRAKLVRLTSSACDGSPQAPYVVSGAGKGTQNALLITIPPPACPTDSIGPENPDRQSKARRGSMGGPIESEYPEPTTLQLRRSAVHLAYIDSLLSTPTKFFASVSTALGTAVRTSFLTPPIFSLPLAKCFDIWPTLYHKDILEQPKSNSDHKM